jgi:hypothetical protein
MDKVLVNDSIEQLANAIQSYKAGIKHNASNSDLIPALRDIALYADDLKRAYIEEKKEQQAEITPDIAYMFKHIKKALNPTGLAENSIELVASSIGLGILIDNDKEANPEPIWIGYPKTPEEAFTAITEAINELLEGESF